MSDQEDHSDDAPPPLAHSVSQPLDYRSQQPNEFAPLGRVGFFFTGLGIGLASMVLFVAVLIVVGLGTSGNALGMVFLLPVAYLVGFACCWQSPRMRRLAFGVLTAWLMMIGVLGLLAGWCMMQFGGL